MRVNASHARKIPKECSFVLVVTARSRSCLVIQEKLALILYHFASIHVIDSYLVESISANKSVTKDHAKGVSTQRRKHADVEETRCRLPALW